MALSAEIGGLSAAPQPGIFKSTALAAIPETSVPSAPVKTADVASTPAQGTTSSIPLDDAKGLTFKSWGDPHEVTGDGLKFDNMGIGTYTAMKSASGDLVVQKKQEKVEGLGAVGSTVNTQAAIKAGSDVIRFEAATDKLFINDVAVTLKDGEVKALPDGSTITRKGNDYTVSTKKGDVITIKDNGKYLDLEGKLADSRKDGEVTGSLGRFDKDTDATNDLVKQDGTLATSADDFIKDWTTKDGDNLLTNPAAKFLSPEAKELGDLKKLHQELFDKEQALGDERRPLLVEVDKNRPIYDVLKKLPADQITEGDQAFMKKFEADAAKVDALSTQIADLNTRQATIQTRIEALQKMIGLDAENALYFNKEQEVGKERLPLLGEVAAKEGTAKKLEELANSSPDKLAPADYVYLEAFRKLKDKVFDLTELIRSLNVKQKDNEEEKRRLDAETKLNDKVLGK